MSYQCRRCQAPLVPEAFACPNCHRKFALPVPRHSAGAEAPLGTAEISPLLWPDVIAARARSRLAIPTIVLSSVFLVGLGLWWLSQSVAKRVEATQDAVAQGVDRRVVGGNGMPLLFGPLVPGGPSLGESRYADMNTEDFGWSFHGPSYNPREITKPYAGVRNKSNQVWYNVAVLVNLTRFEGDVRQIKIPIGRIYPGDLRYGEGEAVEKGIRYSSLVGIIGQRNRPNTP